MPLLHQDTNRGGGGSSDSRRRSLADILGFEPPLFEPNAPTHRDELIKDNCSEWRWEEPSSPEGAHTPRSLVPPACFPPRHPTAFASYSESARPGSGWNDEAAQPGQGITDLVASLKALAMPAGGAPRVQTSIQMRLSYDQDANVPPIWKKNQQSSESRDEKLARRASFCGVVSPSSPLSGGALSWSGKLPARAHDAGGAGVAGGAGAGAGYSPKVFMGGLPWDITEQALLHALRHFQPVRVEWPGRETGVATHSGGPRGYAYVTFESERRVRALLAASRRDAQGDWYYKVASRKIRSKEVQVIPWAVCDASWVRFGCARLEPTRTVFVGALHGMLSAHALAHIMNDLFQGVVFAGIDTDKNKYPIGSGRVTFNNVRSYVRAVSAAYIVIHTDKFTKKVQVDPYLEDSMCSVCNLHQGPYFCREPVCFRYFCCSCWAWQHPSDEHKRLMRSSKSALTNGITYPTHGLTNGPPNGLAYPPNGLSNGPPNGITYTANGHVNGSPNGGYGQRMSPPSDHGSVYNGSFQQSEGMGSPSTSGSGTSGGSEMEPENSDLVWLPR